MKYTPSPVANREIAGHYADTADAYRHINSREHHVSDRRGSANRKYAGISISESPSEVPNTPVDNQSTALRGFHHVIEEIVADNSAIDFLPKRSTISTSPGCSMSMAV